MKVFSRQIYSYGYHISKLNNLKVIHGLYSQCLTKTLSKMTSFFSIEGVLKTYEDAIKIKKTMDMDD